MKDLKHAQSIFENIQIEYDDMSDNEKKYIYSIWLDIEHGFQYNLAL